MKKSYIKLIFLMFFFSLLFILNGFVNKFLSQVTLDILLIVLLVLANLLFGFEKDRHRYVKDVILEILIILISFIVLYYLFGVIVGFAKVGNYYSLKSMTNIILPLVIYIVVGEILRYELLIKSSESRLLIYLVCIFFIIIDTTIPFSVHTNKFDREMFLLIAVTILPSISKNILCTFLNLKFGYKPSIVYLLIVGLFSYLIPIIPNPNEYIYSLIFILFPLYVLEHVKKWLDSDKVSNAVLERYNYKKDSLWQFLPLIAITAVLVYFVSGYFKYYAVAIASGSMEPNISKGDVVIVDKEFNELKEGEVLAYYYDDKVVVHRIYKIIDTNGEYFIYTKGDANNDYDKYKIDKSMIIGVVKIKIPIIGYPTILLNELW